MSLTILKAKDSFAQYGQYRYWAERGRVGVENVQDGGYKTISVAEAHWRVKALKDMCGNSVSRKDRSQFMPKIKETWEFCKKMDAIIATAVEQGEPLLEDTTKHRQLMAPKALSMAGLNRLAVIFTPKTTTSNPLAG